MKKNKKHYIKYFSLSGSGHFYIFKKTKNIKLSLKKFDPIFQKHFVYKIK